MQDQVLFFGEAWRGVSAKAAVDRTGYMQFEFAGAEVPGNEWRIGVRVEHLDDLEPTTVRSFSTGDTLGHRIEARGEVDNIVLTESRGTWVKSLSLPRAWLEPIVALAKTYCIE